MPVGQSGDDWRLMRWRASRMIILAKSCFANWRSAHDPHPRPGGADRGRGGLRCAFWKHVDRRENHDCWPWIGTVFKKDQRGLHQSRGRRMLAPRVAFFVGNGRWLTNLEAACHSCDNPNCCNPSHIWAGSIAENNRDCASKGRMGLQKRTHCKRGHTLVSDNMYIWKGRRSCRECLRLRAKKYRDAAAQESAK